MPVFTFAIPNTFANFNINAMGMQNNYPPPNMGMNESMNQGNNMGMNVGMGPGPSGPHMNAGPMNPHMGMNVHVGGTNGGVSMNVDMNNTSMNMTDRPIY